MQTGQRQRRKDLFEQARKLPAAERDSFLASACGSDLTLRSQVVQLLADLDEAGELLAEPTVAAPTAPVPRIPIGSAIGPYRLIERIGEGGFGEVWLAEQREPVRRKIALKIIKPGMDSKEVLARFEAERQALALMDHPNVAKVFDAGQTDAQSPIGAGRPYFVMEHAAGLPITDYCDTGRLRIRQRLELFVLICQAVQHAHTKGIIHRDLKPSNILVTLVDGKPVPKVIDFGIAKATSAPLTERTLHTEVGRLMGTPEYMSPEQAGTGGIDVDTRSDVYSLGVILYQLLTGTLPLEPQTLRKADYSSLVKIIREMEPPRPSTRLSTLGSEAVNQHGGATPQEIAARRDADFAALQRQVRGELDWIVMKCLEKDRSRRYETANSLATDVTRYLGGEPVVAAPPSRLYRLSKTLRRYRAATVIAAIIVLLVSAGLTATSLLWQHAARARDAESDQRARAEAINTFLKDMLTAADPARTKGARLTVREALDEAAKKIDQTSLRNQPLLEADLLATIGTTYFTLGLYPQALAQLKAAEAIQTRELGDDHAEVLRTRSRIAQCYAWDGDHERAIALARPTLEHQRRLLGNEDPETLRTMSFLGNALMLSSEYLIDVPEKVLREALAGQTRVLGREHEDTIETMLYLAWPLAEQSDESQSLAQEALDISMRMRGPDHPQTLMALNILALAYSWSGDWAKTDFYGRQALDGARRVFGEDHHRTADCLADRSEYLRQIGKLDEAEQCCRQAVEIARRTYGPGKKWTVRYEHELGNIVGNARGPAAEAEILEPTLQEAIQVLGEEDFETLHILLAYGAALARSGRHAEAAEHLGRGREIAFRKAGPAHRWTRDFTRWHAGSLWSLGRIDEAEALLQQNLAGCRAAVGDRAFQTLAQLNAIAELLRSRGKPADAEPLAREALAGYRATQPELRRVLGNPAYTLARILKQQNQHAEALSLASEAAQSPRASAEHLNFAAWELLTTPEEGLRNPSTALELARRADERSSHTNPAHLDTLALAHHRTGRTEKAIELQREALRLLAADAPGRKEYEERLAEFERAGAASAAEGPSP